MNEVLYFSATWCASCNSFAPTFTAAMKSYQSYQYTKIDIDTQFDLARAYGVRSIPCIVILNNGKEIGRLAGPNVTKANLELALA